MQLNDVFEQKFEQGFEQINYVSLRIWFKLIKMINRFVKGTE